MSALYTTSRRIRLLGVGLMLLALLSLNLRTLVHLLPQMSVAAPGSWMSEVCSTSSGASLVVLNATSGATAAAEDSPGQPALPSGLHTAADCLMCCGQAWAAQILLPVLLLLVLALLPTLLQPPPAPAGWVRVGHLAWLTHPPRGPPLHA